ncbi:MAG: DUF4328 domain-containing protein [Actinomycetota bacterium]|nr:DUF4328 domain-containing protein [Actinomycetota bacterium]
MQSTATSPSWYRPIRSLATAITFLLGAQAVVLVARVFAYLDRIRLLHHVARREFVANEQAKLADSHLVVVALAELWVFVFIANVVVWLVWQHRAQANAQHLTTKKLTFSPGWAVGWWFVPFANLVQPFRAVCELWQASGGAGHSEESTWPALALWWIAWLGFELLGSGAASANSASAIAAADEGGWSRCSSVSPLRRLRSQSCEQSYGVRRLASRFGRRPLARRFHFLHLLYPRPPIAHHKADAESFSTSASRGAGSSTSRPRPARAPPSDTGATEQARIFSMVY